MTIVKINNDASQLVKELVNSNKVDETELSNEIAKEIVADIENYVDQHLEIYKKYTLNGPLMLSSESKSTALFYSLISLIKDVSALGRRLLELALQYNAHKAQSNPSSSSTSLPNDQRFVYSSGKTRRENENDDATSEDLLAALIESSSSDDFLVLSSSLDTISTRDMVISALIYIKSHECFTLSHDIQSVAMVLRRTKFMILNIFAPKNQMELITKLLTSIGRYNEMNYIFDLFRDRNQFEILLSKGVEKKPELRIALFNYVKKNPEFYPLVTLNFSMFREIAESLEASAVKRLNKAISKMVSKFKKNVATLDRIASTVASVQEDDGSNVVESSQHPQPQQQPPPAQQQQQPSTSLQSSGTIIPTTTATYDDRENIQQSLNLSLLELVDASDCFAKAGCYKRSSYCEQKAKLIALQLALWQTGGPNVLDVSQSELSELIADFRSFWRAYIVAEAYDYHLAWRQALFKNVVLRCNPTYLLDYCKKCDLSQALVEDLVSLYKQYISNNSQMDLEESSTLAKGFKQILARLSDVEFKCKIYSQLNFEDAKEELLQDAAIQAHLKDLKLV